MNCKLVCLESKKLITVIRNSWLPNLHCRVWLSGFRCAKAYCEDFSGRKCLLSNQSSRLVAKWICLLKRTMAETSQIKKKPFYWLQSEQICLCYWIEWIVQRTGLAAIRENLLRTNLTDFSAFLHITNSPHHHLSIYIWISLHSPPLPPPPLLPLHSCSACMWKNACQQYATVHAIIQTYRSQREWSRLPVEVLSLSLGFQKRHTSHCWLSS